MTVAKLNEPRPRRRGLGLLSSGQSQRSAVSDSRLRWAGLGRTAFVAAFGDPQEFLEDPQEASLGDAVAESLWEIRPGNLTGSDVANADRSEGAVARSALRSFFYSCRHGVGVERGPTPLVLSEAASSLRGHERFGDDGGPGMRTGMFRLFDIEDLTTIVFPRPLPSQHLSRLLDIARERTERFFLLASGVSSEPDARGPEVGSSEACESGQELRFLLPNVALYAPDHPSAPAWARDVGVVAAWLHTSDSDGGSCVFNPSRSLPASFVRAREWRVAEGLRRSIDVGTRWLVFEPLDPTLCRRVEREVLAFLYRMRNRGLVRERRGGFRVRCRMVELESNRATRSNADRVGLGGVDSGHVVLGSARRRRTTVELEVDL